MLPGLADVVPKVENAPTGPGFGGSGLPSEAVRAVTDVLNGVPPAPAPAGPTAAQVHVALSVLRAGRDIVSETAWLAAQQAVNQALSMPGWTGAATDCLPFGVEAERARGQHDHLLELLDRSGAVIDELQTFVEGCTDKIGPGVAMEARAVLARVKLLAEGKPDGTEGSNRSSATDAGSGQAGEGDNRDGAASLDADLRTARENHNAKLAGADDADPGPDEGPGDIDENSVPF